MRTIGLKPGDRVLLLERDDETGTVLVHNALAILISMDPKMRGPKGEFSIDAAYVPAGDKQCFRAFSQNRVPHWSHPDWREGSAEFAYEELPPQSGVCMFCGCTESRACVDDNGDGCRWIDEGKTVCSAFACLERITEEGGELLVGHGRTDLIWRNG